MAKSLVAKSIERMPMIESGRLNFTHFFAAMVNITFFYILYVLIEFSDSVL